jgi:hypothetical protein
MDPEFVETYFVGDKLSPLYCRVQKLPNPDLFHCFRFHLSFEKLFRNTDSVINELGYKNSRYMEENYIFDKANISQEERTWIIGCRNMKAEMCVKNFRQSSNPEFYIAMYEKQFEDIYSYDTVDLSQSYLQPPPLPLQPIDTFTPIVKPTTSLLEPKNDVHNTLV